MRMRPASASDRNGMRGEKVGRRPPRSRRALALEYTLIAALIAAASIAAMANLGLKIGATNTSTNLPAVSG